MQQISGFLTFDNENIAKSFACRATAELDSEGTHVGLHGAAIWRGTLVTSGNQLQVLGEIIQRYRDAGVAVLHDLTGPFALSIVQPASRSALLAVDRMGIERLTYALRDRELVFATSAEAVASHQGARPQLRHQAIYDYLFMHMVPSPETVFEGVSKLPPACALVVDSGSASLQRYWEPNYDFKSDTQFESLKERVHTALQQGVVSSGLDDKTGAFLSGGLDSSSVTGTLSRSIDGQAKTFTVGFGEADYDELEFARIANNHFDCQSFEFHMTPDDIVNAFPIIATAYDEPFGNSSAAPTYFCAKLAADNGVTHLLAGDGGDELFAGNERYVRQSVFEIYRKLPKFLRSTLLDPLSRLASEDSRIMPLRKLRSYVDQARVPLPERFETWNFMYREGGQQMLDADFARGIDPQATLQVMRDVWKEAPSENLLEKMLWYDWHFTLADNDLRKVGTMAALAGVRVSYPLLHDDVIQVSNCVPPKMKIKGVELRDFFKRAMSDFLPREIIEKKKHGFGSPFGVWLKTDPKLSEMTYSYLSDLKRRNIIASDFIDKLIEQHRGGHPSYFGYAIWDLAMLEAWLARHID